MSVQTEQPPVPPVAQKQPKSLPDTFYSMQKGAQGLGLANLAHSVNFGAWNMNRRAKQIAAGVLPSQSGAQSGAGQSEPDEPPALDSAMRIDSDDIHYHLMPAEPQPAATNPLASVMKAGLLAAAVAVPGYGLVTQLPAIISAVKGVSDAVPAANPSTPSTDDPFLGLGVKVGDPKE